MDRPWELRSLDESGEQAEKRLVKELELHPAAARVLVGRGLDDVAAAVHYLNPKLGNLRPPVGMDGFDDATRRIIAALQGGQAIGVYGDYDVDGVTTTTLLTHFLRSVGGMVVPRVASRDRGYGFGEVDAIWFADRGCKLIITVDCGTSDLPAILAARARGVDVIVVDHHQVPERAEHPSVALLNPHRPDSTYPFRGLASVGLGFYLAAALRTALAGIGWFASRPMVDPRQYLDLVALGTVADLAPLKDENRVLVSAGLREMQARRRPGLAALLRIAGCEPDKQVDEIDIGWRLAPRLNAPGRLGDAEPSLLLLLSATPREAEDRAVVCEDANQRRRLLQESMFQEALVDAATLADQAAIVVARRGWHAGVAGIVAAKLVERFRKPSAVIAIDALTQEGRGSLRTAGRFDLFRALTACHSLLIRYGGHAAAAGLTIAESNVPDLRAAFAELAGRADARTGAMAVDARLPLGAVTEKLAIQLGAMAPFGNGNEAPIISAEGAIVRGTRRVGDDGAHLKLTLECAETGAAHSAIAFRMGERDPGAGARVDVAYCPEISQFRGERRLELKITDLKLLS
jgi:single-stranded-DNA-specific exonuclease